MFLASAPDTRITGQYFEGTRAKKLPPRVLDVTLQERVWELGDSLVARAREKL